MNNSDDSYSDSLQRVLDICGNDMLYADYAANIPGADNSISVYRKLTEKHIDETWVKRIEEGIPSLDAAIRNPRTFITDVEEILPIEMTKKITPASIKHLAQHTNLIRSFDGENVVPSHLLNTFKEESYDTYENKFVYTLINNLYIFIDKRFEHLQKTVEDDKAAALNMESDVCLPNGETVHYKIEITSKSTPVEKRGRKTNIKTDLRRIERIRNIIQDYMCSEFALTMKKYPLIKPPVMRTNAIMKDVNLKNCLALWMFIQGYDMVGYEIVSKDGFVELPGQCAEDFYITAAIQYALFKKYSGTATQLSTVSAPIKPSMIKLLVKRLAESYDFCDVEVQRVINAEIGLASNRRAVRDKNILDAIDRVIEGEKQAERSIRLLEAKKEKEEKERQRIEKLKEKAEQRRLAAKERKKKLLIKAFEKKNEGKKSSIREKAMEKLKKRLQEIDDE